MPSIPIYYFSASGNTKYCSQLVQRGLVDKDIKVDLIRINTVRNLPFPEHNISYAAIGLAFPVYEFMVPRIVLIWLYKLPIAPQKTPVFILDTSGGLPCDSAQFAMNILKKKNYEPLGVLEVPTPNLEPFFDNKYYPVGWPKEILDRCYYFGALIAIRLRKEEDQFIDMRLGRFRFSLLTKYMHRYFLNGQSSSAGLIKFNRDKCTKCGACEKVCPMAAIDIKKTPLPINLNRCMFCATCIRVCPTHAIYISYRPKKVPIPAKLIPRSRPGYIDPKDYKSSRVPSFSVGYMRLFLKMMQVRKKIKKIN